MAQDGDDIESAIAAFVGNPTTRERANRILAAVGRSPALPLVQYPALVSAVAEIMYLAIQAWAWRRELKASDARRIVGQLSALATSLANAQFSRGAPPMPPAAWLLSMQSWAKDALAGEGVGGRPTGYSDRWLYPKLLAMYRLAFAVEPSSSLQGPTFRFVRSFHAELAAARQGADSWSVPKDEALRMAIRRHIASSKVDQWSCPGTWCKIADPRRGSRWIRRPRRAA